MNKDKTKPFAWKNTRNLQSSPVHRRHFPEGFAVLGYCHMQEHTERCSIDKGRVQQMLQGVLGWISGWYITCGKWQWLWERGKLTCLLALVRQSPGVAGKDCRACAFLWCWPKNSSSSVYHTWMWRDYLYSACVKQTSPRCVNSNLPVLSAD